MAILLPETLHTPRLKLREPRQADAQHLYDAYTRDAEVTRYLTWRPHQSINETERFIAYCMDAWSSGKSRPYILTLRDDDAMPIGLLEARLLDDTIDLGYALRRSCWGSGLMAEAVMAVTEAALRLPACARVQATCDAENHASARTLEKCGFVSEHQPERFAVLPNLGDSLRLALMYARC